MKGTFTLRVQALLNRADYDPPVMEYEILEVQAGWGRDSDYIESSIYDMPSDLENIFDNEIEEEGVYQLEGKIWLTDNEDDYGDVDITDYTIARVYDKDELKRLVGDLKERVAHAESALQEASLALEGFLNWSAGKKSRSSEDFAITVHQAGVAGAVIKTYKEKYEV